MIAFDLGPKILSARVICADNRGPKVLLCEDGEIVKYFRRGRFLSHNGYLKKADQFARNAELIRSLGFKAPENIQIIDGIAGEDTAVRYRPVPGRDLGRLVSKSAESKELCLKLGRLMRVFHDAGVVFKANHLANFIYQPGEPLGVIDLDNLYKLPFEVPVKPRVGNLMRLIKRDQKILQLRELLKGYCGEQHSPSAQAAVDRVVARSVV